MSSSSGIGAAFAGGVKKIQDENRFQAALNSPTAQANRLAATGSTATIAEQSRPGWSAAKPAAPGLAGAPGTRGAPLLQKPKPSAIPSTAPGAPRPPLGRGMNGEPPLSQTPFGTGMNGEPPMIARPAPAAPAPGAFAATGGVPVDPGNPAAMAALATPPPAAPRDNSAARVKYIEDQLSGARIRQSGIGDPRRGGGTRTTGRRGARAGDTVKGGRFTGKLVDDVRRRLEGEFDATNAPALP